MKWILVILVSVFAIHEFKKEHKAYIAGLEKTDQIEKTVTESRYFKGAMRRKGLHSWVYQVQKKFN